MKGRAAQHRATVAHPKVGSVGSRKGRIRGLGHWRLEAGNHSDSRCQGRRANGGVFRAVSKSKANKQKTKKNAITEGGGWEGQRDSGPLAALREGAAARARV